MTNWDVALMAMVAVSALGFLLADGERRRVRYIQAMRRCLLRMNDIIRYEQPPLCELLERVELRATQQERELTELLHASAARMKNSVNPQLMLLFAGESARLPGYGVLAEEDRSAFENVLAELGRTGLREQLRLLGEADERLRAREEILRREADRRAQLLRTLGLTGGAAVFLLLI